MTDEPRKMLLVEQVLQIVPFSRTTLWRLEREGRFPASTFISRGRRAWYADEVVAWQKSLPTNDLATKV